MPELFGTRAAAVARAWPAAAPVKAFRAASGLAVTTTAMVMITLALNAAPALAQYKWVAADGSVSYGDRPPPGVRTTDRETPGRDAPARHASAHAAPDAPTLPYELRLAAQRQPVTLYTTPDCPPCDQARGHLAARGIPYSERAVRSQADAGAFRALGFDRLSFPALAVGRDRATGFEAVQWNSMLDIAGYPKTSRLPARWQPAPAQALAGIASEAGSAPSGARASEGDSSGASPAAAADSEATTASHAGSAAEYRATGPSAGAGAPASAIRF